MQLLGSMVKARLQPDRITVYELITSLTDQGKNDEVDKLFEVATHTGSLIPSMLDDEWEVDISQLPSSVAKAK
ncbi:unnamed protein product, partial [Choristocarpus tenellus]